MTEVLLLWSRFDAEWDARSLAAARAAMPSAILEHMPRYRRWQDVQMALLGKLLLRRVLSDGGGDRDALDGIAWTEIGRPSLPGERDFNISHSGCLVACALAGAGRIGLDVEQIRPIALDDLDAVMAPGERDGIEATDDPAAALYHLWTFKEAVIKADGRGVGIDLQSFDCHTTPARVGGTSWHVQAVEIVDGFACHVASDRPPLRLTAREVDWQSLLDQRRGNRSR